MENYFKLDEIVEFTIQSLEEREGYCSAYGADLHNEIFNTDYYIIGRYEAKKWLSDEVFYVIDIITEYEKNNFGEILTDLSEPEKVVNMYVYVLGKEILYNSDHLNNVCWNRQLEEDDFSIIIEEIKDHYGIED